MSVLGITPEILIHFSLGGVWRTSFGVPDLKVTPMGGEHEAKLKDYLECDKKTLLLLQYATLL